MIACSNCGQQVPDDSNTCPNCGQPTREMIWPPPIAGQPDPPVVRYKTGTAKGDIARGIALTVGLFVLCWVGVIAVPIIYNKERRYFPIYARAMGWTYIVMLVGVLGAFMACFVSIIPNH